MSKLTILAYIYFVSWTGVFALSSWIRLPFLFVLIALATISINIVMRGRIATAPYKAEDYLIIAFLIALMFSAVINPNVSSLNYLLAYSFVLMVLYLFVKGALYSYTTPHQIYIANMWGVTFVGIFLTINFVLNIYGIIDLQSIIPRLRETTALYYGSYERGYGFSTEPGIVAFYLNVLGPLALWYLWREIRILFILKLIITILICFGWLVTFSASGWAFLILGLAMSAMITSLWNKQIKIFKHPMFKTWASVFVVFALVLGLFMSNPNIRNYAHPIYMKLTLSENIKSSSERIGRWKSGVEKAFDKPFLGQGIGYFSSKDIGSSLNWYLMLLIEGGFVSFFIMILFLGFVFIRIVRYHHPSRFAILTGYLAGCGHLLVISTFYHPFLWLLIAIFYAQQSHYNRHQRSIQF